MQIYSVCRPDAGCDVMCKGYGPDELPDEEPFAQNIKFCLYRFK